MASPPLLLLYDAERAKGAECARLLRRGGGRWSWPVKAGASPSAPHNRTGSCLAGIGVHCALKVALHNLACRVRRVLEGVQHLDRFLAGKF